MALSSTARASTGSAPTPSVLSSKRLQAADVGRIEGHCGGPPTDFIEQVHLIVYDQNRGRLQANHFSYSGNPQGCDPAIRNLQAAIDAFQVRLTTPAMTGAAPAQTGTVPNPGPAFAPGPVPGAGDSVPAPLAPPNTPESGATPISLTPIN